MQLLEKSRKARLQPAESRELTLYAGVACQDTSPDMLCELRQAIDLAKNLQAAIVRATALLDKAETERWSQQERTALSALERSMKRDVASVLSQKCAWYQKLVSGEWPGPAGKVLAEELRSRILDCGSTLCQEILPRSRWLRCIDVPVLIRPVDKTLRETVWFANEVALSAMPDRVASGEGSVERALKLLEKSATKALTTLERRELISLVGPNRQAIKGDTLVRFREILRRVRKIDARIERLDDLLTAGESRLLDLTNIAMLADLLESNRWVAARARSETIPKLLRMVTDPSLAPEAQVIARALRKRVYDQVSTLHRLHVRAIWPVVGMEPTAIESGARLAASGRST